VPTQWCWGDQGAGPGVVVAAQLSAMTRMICYTSMSGGRRRRDPAGRHRLTVPQVRIAAAAKAGVSLPALLARSVVCYMTDCAARGLPAGGGAVSASFLNAKASV
jgi:hypothetical protein